MDPPHPYRADHDHSDEHLNLAFTTYGSQTEPPAPTGQTMITPTSTCSLPPSPSVSPENSGDFSPSELHSQSRRKRSRSMDATPASSAIRLLFTKEERQDGVLERQAEEGALSSGWSASEEDPESSVNLISEETDPGERSRRKSNIFTHGLRRACKCVGVAGVAAANKISRSGSGAEKGCGTGGVGSCGGGL